MLPKQPILHPVLVVGGLRVMGASLPTPSRRIKKHGATKTDALLLVYLLLLVSIQFLYMLMI